MPQPISSPVEVRARLASSTWRLSFVAIAATATFVLASSSALAAASRSPVVFFPGYGTTVLRVSVHNQTGVKGCPRSGSFQDGIPANVGTTFSQVCRDKLITPRWKSNYSLSFSKRFSLPPGVKVSIPHYGQTASAPIYNPLYAALEAAGYRADRNLVVAGYDFRLTPDLDGFMSRTKRLIVRTWRLNHERPVRLVGHSNGPLYAQYLLTHVSPEWKHKYIQGFTDIAGNLPGQGALWTWVFTGVEVPSAFSLPTTVATARSSARLMALSPATWMSASDPAVFGRREVVIRNRATGRSYTPADTARLLHDAGLESIKPMVEHYLGFVRFADRHHFPNVDVSAEKGSGLPTPVGIVLPNLTRGQVVDQATADYIDLPGDSNQEYITNNAVGVWRKMRCYRFRLTDNPGVSHLGLVTDRGLIRRLLADLARPRSRCPVTG
jgi:lecithin-cholesterol acyltransferase